MHMAAAAVEAMQERRGARDGVTAVLEAVVSLCRVVHRVFLAYHQCHKHAIDVGVFRTWRAQ